MLTNQKLKVINIGLESFANSLKSQNADVVHVNWNPPAGGDTDIMEKLIKVKEKSLFANKEAARRLINSHPILVDIKQAIDVIPEMTKNTILHAGPPIKWERMCGPMQGAVIGALIYEGYAENFEQATELIKNGEINFSPCHHHQTVGPMAGIVSSSMYVFVVKNETYGNYAYCTLNEGLGKVLRFGAYDEEVIKRLKWMESELAPALKKAVLLSKGIYIKNLTIQALQMGDECHNRNVAGTTLFLKEITPYLLDTDTDKGLIKKVIEFIGNNPHFFLNLSMAACKATADTILGLENSSIVSAMARNGVEIGIRVGGLKDKWFTWQAGQPKGLYFAGFSEQDANRDLGDSTISEVAGIGAVAMASSPAIVKFVGGTPADAVKYTREMYEITTAKHAHYQIPTLNFMGTPVGIDICQVVETGITPIINTGIAHKKAGIGQVGAGILRAPIEIFKQALEELYN